MLQEDCLGDNLGWPIFMINCVKIWHTQQNQNFLGMIQKTDMGELLTYT